MTIQPSGYQQMKDGIHHFFQQYFCTQFMYCWSDTGGLNNETSSVKSATEREKKTRGAFGGSNGSIIGGGSIISGAESDGDEYGNSFFTFIVNGVFLHFQDYGKYPIRSLLLLWSIFFVLIIITERIDRSYNLQDQIESHLENSDDTSLIDDFMAVVYISIIVSIPIVVDTIFSFFIELAGTNSNEKEMVRSFVLLVISLPNLLLYMKIFSPSVIDLIVFYQFMCIFQLAIFIILKISARQKILLFVSFTNVSMAMIAIGVCAFYYNLSCHKLIPGEVAWRAIFSSSLVVVMLYAGYKIRSWISFTPLFTWLRNRFSSCCNGSLHKSGQGIIVDSVENGVYSAILLILFCSIMAALANIATFEHNHVFFPSSLTSCIAFEWYFVVMLIMASAIRNFQVRNSEVFFAKQLIHNRKMTGAISHEIRTPLNTAFMALDLLSSTLAAPNSSIQDDVERENLLEIAKTVKDGCDISLNILNELLTFEKLSAGMMQIEPKIVPLVSHVETNVAVFHMQARQKGIDLCTAISMEERARFKELHLYIDEHKMSQVARNLLSNALKFTPKGGKVTITVKVEADEAHMAAIAPTLGKRSRFPSKLALFGNGMVASSPSPFNTDSILPTSVNIPDEGERRRRWWQRFLLPIHKSNDVAPLTTSIHRTQNHTVGSLSSAASSHSNDLIFHEIPGAKPYGSLRICVTDTGPGIAKEDINKLFKEYVQINPGELQKGQGSGLGLSICKSILALHGGNIWVESEGKGHGCTFVVELPLYYKPIQSNVPSQADNRSANGMSIRSVMPWRNAFLGGGMISRPGSEKGFGSGYHSFRSATSSVNNGPAAYGTVGLGAGISGGGSNSMHYNIRVSNKGVPVNGATSGRFSSMTGIDDLESQNCNNQIPFDSSIHDDTHLAAEIIANLKISTSPATGDDNLSNCTINTAITNNSGSNGIGVVPNATGAAIDNDVPQSVHSRHRQGSTSSTSAGNSVVAAVSLLPQSPKRSAMMNQSNHNSNKIVTGVTTTGAVTVTAATGVTPRHGMMSPPQSVPIDKSITFLVVDDSAANRKMLARLLQRDGYQVIEADDGTTAVEVMNKINAQRRPSFLGSLISGGGRLNAEDNNNNGNSGMTSGNRVDIILIDFFMKKMNGPEAVRKIRKQGFTGPIIGITGLVDEDCDVFIQHGADIVLCKPVSVQGIWKALNSMGFIM